MCDDFWDGWDMDDVFNDPDNVFEEDSVGEYECQKKFDEDSAAQLKDEEQRRLDLADTMIIGAMIAGCAFDENTSKRKIKTR